jgi:hypothetical protein
LVEGWAIKNWACEEIYGYCKNCTPAPTCIKPDNEFSWEKQDLLISEEIS